MREHLPALACHFKEIDFAPEMYLYEWVLTLFSQILPTSIAYRVWDSVLLIGDSFIFKTTIALLRTLLPHLLNCPFETVATLLTRGVDTIGPFVVEEELFTNIELVNLDPKRFDTLLKLCTKELNEN